MFYVFADTESFTYDAEVDFGSIVWRDGGCWIGLSIKIPRISCFSCDRKGEIHENKNFAK